MMTALILSYKEGNLWVIKAWLIFYIIRVCTNLFDLNNRMDSTKPEEHNLNVIAIFCGQLLNICLMQNIFPIKVAFPVGVIAYVVSFAGLALNIFRFDTDNLLKSTGTVILMSINQIIGYIIIVYLFQGMHTKNKEKLRENFEMNEHLLAILDNMEQSIMLFEEEEVVYMNSLCKQSLAERNPTTFRDLVNSIDIKWVNETHALSTPCIRVHDQNEMLCLIDIVQMD